MVVALFAEDPHIPKRQVVLEFHILDNGIVPRAHTSFLCNPANWDKGTISRDGWLVQFSSVEWNRLARSTYHVFSQNNGPDIPLEQKLTPAGTSFQTGKTFPKTSGRGVSFAGQSVLDRVGDGVYVSDSPSVVISVRACSAYLLQMFGS